MVWPQGSAWHVWEGMSNLYFFGLKLSRWQYVTSQVFARAPKQAVVSKCITTFTFVPIICRIAVNLVSGGPQYLFCPILRCVHRFEAFSSVQYELEIVTHLSVIE
jgi:hypothetical protein